MRYLRDLSLEELEELCAGLADKPYRARQIFAWLYNGKSSVQSIDEMMNLPLSLRRRLKGAAQAEPGAEQPEQGGKRDGSKDSDDHRSSRDGWDVGVLRVLVHQVSAKDGTEKYLFELPDGNAVESVLMLYSYGYTVCVSTQAGCRMGCSFCASGLNGLLRDLSAGEIVSQVIDIMRNSRVKVNHVVFMGTGEPFDNYENMAKAIRILTEKKGLGMSARNITVSTSGIVPGIERFGADFPQVNLAISLHAPNDDIRQKIMPVDRAYPIKTLLDACDAHAELTSRRITFEYAMIKGVNDSEKCLRELTQLLKGHLAHVNLIPLNEVDETGLRSSGRGRALDFKEYLEAHGVPASVRRELGTDIDGACGQLRNRT